MGQRGKCLFDGAQQQLAFVGTQHHQEPCKLRALGVPTSWPFLSRPLSPSHHRQLSVPLPPLLGLAYPHATHVFARLGALDNRRPFNRGWTPGVPLFEVEEAVPQGADK